MNTALSERILACVRELATNRAIIDTVWLGGPRDITVCEELAEIATELGATYEETCSALGSPVLTGGNSRNGGASDERT